MLAFERKCNYRTFTNRNKRWLFLVESKSELAEQFKDSLWLASLSYLVNKLDWLSTLNLSLQGWDAGVLLLADKVDSFVWKCDLWRACVIAGNYEMFPNWQVEVSFCHLFRCDFLGSLIVSYGALKHLPFTSTYLCEAGFSKLTALGPKYRDHAHCPSTVEQFGPGLQKLKNPWSKWIQIIVLSRSIYLLWKPLTFGLELWIGILFPETQIQNSFTCLEIFLISSCAWERQWQKGPCFNIIHFKILLVMLMYKLL